MLRTTSMFRVEIGKYVVVGVGLMAKLDEQRREQPTQLLLLVLPKVTIEERQGGTSIFPQSVDVPDDFRAVRML